VTISGNLNTLLVRADLELENGSLYGEAFDRGHAEFEATEKEIIFKQASLAHGSSSVHGKGEIRFQGAYRTELESENFELKDSTVLNRFLPGLEGSFKGTIGGMGTFDHPQMKLTGILPFLLYRNQSLRGGAIDLSLQDSDLDARVTFKDRPVSMTGTISLTEPFLSKLAIQGEDIPLAPLIATTSGYQTSALSGSFSGKLEIDGPLSHPQTLNYSVNLSALNAELSGYPVSNQDNIVFQLREGALTIEAFRLKGEGTSLTIAGGLQLFKQFNLFITGEADLSLLKSIKKEISYGQGKAYLALNISDSWNDPKFQGGITVQDGEIRTSILPRTIHISSLGLFFNERQVLLESLDIDPGEGVLHVTGKIDLNRFRIGRFGLILEARESRFSLFSGWASTVSGSLIYQGDLSSQSLQGELTLSQGVYNKKFDFRTLLNRVNKLGETREPTPLIGNTRLNIRLTGDKELKIDNNVARLPFLIDLTLKGTVDHPVLIGRLEADSGTILFYNKSFEVLGAAIDFIDPESINPMIDIKAKTQIIGKDRTYQIELSLSGTLQELNRTLTSDDPTLTETDIWALILAGRKATEVAANPYSQQQIGGQFIPLVIESPLENVLEEVTGLDRLTIEPLSSSVRSTGGPRVTIEQRLMGGKLLLNYSYTVNPSQDQIIKLDYLINRHIYLQGMRNEDGNPAGNITFRFEFK
jgi:autotransporter translocation and assembly factor TamB